ncbi:MAG TPA: hypothetical protein VHX43_03000 [Xanthobacteraceae bacterium]|nr:hypothetical protein [Xanthobacteraceae bacterium]
MKHRPVSTRVFAALALMGAAATAGCSPVSYPSLFPAVEQAPPQRADTPMDANQVQQATEALISDRNHLSAEAQGSGETPAAAAAKKPAGSAAPDSDAAAPASGQTAGTETK